MYDVHRETSFSQKELLMRETCVWHNESESKRQFLEYKHTDT